MKYSPPIIHDKKSFPVFSLAALLIALSTAAPLSASREVLVGDFEPSGTPATLTPFSFTGGDGGATLLGGSVDANFGNVPAATEGTNVYGVSWGDPEADNTVELGCAFALPSGFQLTDFDSVLLDVYAPSGTVTTTALGIWFSDISTWVPEGSPVGVNDSWQTLAVDISTLIGGDQAGLNLAFKNVTGAGILFIDNLRLQQNDPVTELIGDLEPLGGGGTPLNTSPFDFTGGLGGAILAGGATDASFGLVPSSTQGSYVYGLDWGDPGVDNDIEIYCEFASSPGFDLQGNERILVDVYVPSGTSTAIGLGLWLTGPGVWIPEGSGIGSNDQWVTMAVDISTLSDTGLYQFNLAFKNVPSGAGRLYYDNIRLESSTVPVELSSFMVE